MLNEKKVTHRKDEVRYTTGSKAERMILSIVVLVVLAIVIAAAG